MDHAAVLYIPVLTTVLSLGFAAAVFRRYLERGRPLHLLWWSAGILMFGVGTFMEGWTALFGWDESVFRAWYISGALLGAAPLAQGTVYLLLERRIANRLTVVLAGWILLAAVLVLLSPVDAAKAEEHRLTADVLEWSRVRFFSPFVNTYAAAFLIGGAIVSARRYRGSPATSGRFAGNVCIAIGAILPGIGGSFTRAGYTEVLYVTELAGILFIYAGFRLNVRGRPARPAPERAASVGSRAEAGPIHGE